MACNITKINDHTWKIDENGGVYFFLLEGSEYALLIDSGMETRNAKEIAEGLTKKPVLHLITHADIDHLGSVKEFETFYMHPSEASNYYNSGKNTGDFIPVDDGEIIDLGERELEIILLPGHTPGSIAVLDHKYRMLISGDPIQDGKVFMFGVQREVHSYIKCLDKISCFKDEFDAIYPSHGTCPLKPDFIDELRAGMKEFAEGKLEAFPEEFMGIPLKGYRIGEATLLMDA